MRSQVIFRDFAMPVAVALATAIVAGVEPIAVD